MGRMDLVSSSAAINFRRLFRTVPGLKRLAVYGLRLRNSDYEFAFDRELSACVLPGDVVWDVGANVGHYSQKFLAMVGGEGRVVAFEPAPAAARMLRELSPTPEVLELALSSADGEARLSVAEGDAAPVNRLSPDGGLTVRIARGDSLVQAGIAPRPGVVKIDTEGHELEVLRGLISLRPRAILIEVHFGILAERQQATAPRTIVDLLKAHQYKTDWCDPSHLVARYLASN